VAAPQLVTTVDALRAALAAKGRSGDPWSRRAVGFVPTMGALHAGHRTLLAAARASSDVVVASIFVNPLQFGPAEDLDAYPRPLDADLAACGAEGVDLVFAPSVREMYPRPMATSVRVAGVTDGLCGASRPGHFDGVATVVTKLLAIVGPCTAYFGRKDFQQLAVIRRLVADLSLPVDVVGCPLVRDPDGLAMSSRNAYLSAEERSSALALSRSLRAGADAVVAGERSGAALHALVAAGLGAEPGVVVDYVAVVDVDGLAPVDRLDGAVLVAVAARVGGTRLIDNVVLDVRTASVAVDLGTTVNQSQVHQEGVPCAAGC
jgi:pantoate--beta-alanine ligase